MFSISKKSIVSLLCFFLIPIIGFVLSIISLNSKKNNLLSYIIISFFFAYIFIYIPPLGDLYRHYNSFLNISHLSFTEKDFLLHVYFALFHALNLPFYFIPGSVVFLSTLLILLSFSLLIKNQRISISYEKYILSHVIILLNINYFTIASGLRYGLAISIVIYAFSHYITNKKKTTFIILFLISILLHFSMLFFILPFFSSRIIKIKRISFFFICIISFILSSYSYIIFEIISNHIQYGHSYINGKWSSGEDKNIYGKIRIIINQVPFFLMLFFFSFFSKRKLTPSLNMERNIIFWLSIFLLLTHFSFTIFTRFSILPTFLIIFYLLKLNSFKISYIYGLIVIFSINFMVDSLYGYRRQVLLGEMWRPLYLSPIMTIDYSDKHYRTLLSQVDKDGFWIKDPVAKNN
ncbi:hypothetical protein Xmau_02568 [Xenorhabdus mauleonii]|uniref:EpsG family protein n=1 Tax=Xenorhabdus mauleonii TaxID=351675 RepID=A0A1I3TYE0_9GAMM|nr:hypothetical protein Xmau_02568 [Xenorhabdus mauleonii]SFJ75309.1 EpsG family protein [Xenorhabdus mauleonii]